MADERTVKTILKYEVDRASLSKTEQANKSLKRSLDAQTSDLSELRSELNRTAKEWDKLAKSAGRAGIEQLKAARAPQGKGGLSRSEAFGKASTGVGALASLPGGGALGTVGDIAGAAEQLPSLVSSVAALGPAGILAGAAVAGVVLILGNLAAESEKARLAEIARQDALTEAARLAATGTKEQIQAARDAAQVELDIQKQRVADLIAQRNALEGAQDFGDSIEDLLNIGGQGNLDGIRDSLDKALEAAQKAEFDVQAYNAALDKNATAANDAALAEKKLTEERIAALDKNIALETQLSTIRDTGTSKAVLSRLHAIERERQVIEDLTKESGLGAEELQKYTDRLADLTTEQRGLNQILPGLQERETAQERLLAREKEMAAQEEDRARIEGELIDATKEYNAEVTKLNEDALKKAADLTEDYNQKLVDLATEAAEAAESALANLQDHRAQLAQDFGREELNAQQEAQLEQFDAQIQFHREEARALRDHERNLKAIRERAADQEQDLILNRDFAGLFQLRRNTSRELDTANQAYSDQQAERAIAFQQENEDRLRQFEFERAARAQKYAQDLQDAQAAYAKELQQNYANLNKQRQLALQAYNQAQQDLNTSLTNQLATRRQAYLAELQMAQQTGQQRVQLEQQISQALLQQATGVLNAIRGSAVASAAASVGGALAGGFGGIAGLGGLASAAMGAVNNSRAVTLNQTNNVSGGMNPQQVADLVSRRTVDTLQRIFS